MKIPEFVVAAVFVWLIQTSLPADAQAACPRGGYRYAFTEITFTDLELPFQTDVQISRRQLPPSVRRLMGRRVRIVGFAMPGELSFQMSKFVLRQEWQMVPPGPERLRDEVIVEVAPGRAIEFTPNPLIIEGILTLRDFEIEGKVITVFAITDSRLVPRRGR